MDAQIYAAIIGLGLVVIASIGAIVKALTDRVLHDLARNTRLTRDAKDAANGKLQDALRELALERDRALALRAIIREQDDRLAFLKARAPQVEDLLRAYGRRREDRVDTPRENALLARLLEDIDDPTGSNSGRFKPP